MLPLRPQNLLPKLRKLLLSRMLLNRKWPKKLSKRLWKKLLPLRKPPLPKQAKATGSKLHLIRFKRSPAGLFFL
jgi:hypothetical protein